MFDAVICVPIEASRLAALVWVPRVAIGALVFDGGDAAVIRAIDEKELQKFPHITNATVVGTHNPCLRRPIHMRT